MKTGISTFIAAIVFLLLGTSNIEAQNVYFKKNGVTVFQSAVSGIDSIVFKEIYDIGFIAPYNNADPFIFTDSEENSFIAFYLNQQTGIINEGLFVKDNETFIIWYDDAGLPIRAYTKNVYFTFTKYNFSEGSLLVSAFSKNMVLIAESTYKSKEISQLIELSQQINDRAYSPGMRAAGSDQTKQTLEVSALGLGAAGCAAAFLSGVGTIPSIIVCGSVFVSHVGYYVKNFTDYDKNGSLMKAADYFGCGASVIPPYTPDKYFGMASCGFSITASKVAEAEENYDTSWDIPKTAKRFIRVTTNVTDITDNSAVMIGEFIISDEAKYTIDNQWAELFGEFADQHQYITDNTKFESKSGSFRIPLSNLQPNTSYSVRAGINTDTYELVNGNTVNFETSSKGDFLNLSTYAINFKKEGGTEPIDIETNCEITDISFFVQPVDNWCSFSYDESTKSISVSAKANTTNSPRPQVTLEVKAKCSNGEPKSKLVLINQEAGVAETGDWVLINGVCWATCNVGAKNPEDFGGYYQWNTSSFLGNDYWKSNYWNSTSWQPANDPSPAGYRVPTQTELQSLLNTTNVSSSFTTLNGVYGLKFTDKKNGNNIFLPAAGQRSSGNGTLYYVGSHCFYWSATYSEDYGEGAGAYELYFGSTLYGTYGPWIDWDSQSMGFSIRPVAK